ncbi:MAG: FtsH protease activity modulator HflK [Candidatus Aureabacteria bacterium]|nr:FtsH protease activity modulator HflK [Candidatus Auribacterota bacterium]
MSQYYDPAGLPPMPSMQDIKKNLKWFVLLMLAALLIGSFNSTFFIIETDEKGVIQRFGKLARTVDPGFGLKLPLGIETLTKVKVTVVQKEEFGFSSQANLNTNYFSHSQNSRWYANQTFNKQVGFDEDSYLAESLMLTGDLNFAEVTWTIQYKITDPVSYLFNVKDVTETIRNMSESVVREVVGDRSIDEVLTFGKEEIQNMAKSELQKVLDQFGCGVTITQLVFQDVNPPVEVKSAFEEVNKAEQEKNKAINEAWADYNKIIPKAKGEAEKVISEAEGYAINRVNLAKGDAERFLATLKEYQNAKDVTRKRLYLETLTRILPKINKKIIVDTDVKGILPFLNLNEKGGKGGDIRE